MSLTPKANASPSSPATRMGQVHRIHSFSHPVTRSIVEFSSLDSLRHGVVRPKCHICPLDQQDQGVAFAL